MNKASPEAYSVVNLPLHTICNTLALKYKNHSAMLLLWDALHQAFGQDFFLPKIEQVYQGKLVKNKEQLAKELD